MAGKNKQDSVTPEWSHLFEVSDIADKAASVSISPDEESRKNLAKRLGVLSLEVLSTDISLKRESGGRAIHVSGSLKAKLTQKCVVTLEPVKEEIAEEFEAWYADPEEAISLVKVRHDREAAKPGGEHPILEEKDDPEPIIDGQIDLGELVTQYLSLALNPYPRADGVEYEHGDDPDKPAQPADIRKNPFAALKNWKASQD